MTRALFAAAGARLEDHVELVPQSILARHFWADGSKLDLELTTDQLAGKKFYRGRGCEKCNRSGYKGRMGLFELLIMNDELRDMVMRNASTEDLREAARRAGMVTLRDSGMEGIFAGTTTAEEVIRETILDA